MGDLQLDLSETQLRGLYGSLPFAGLESFDCNEDLVVSLIEDLQAGVETLQLRLSMAEVQVLFDHLEEPPKRSPGQDEWAKAIDSTQTADVFQSMITAYP